MKQVMRWALVAALLVSGVPCALADGVQGGTILGADSAPIKMLTVTADTASAGSFSPRNLILGFKLVADDAGDSCGLYDTASLTTTTASVLIDEWYEATDNETNTHLWPRPYQLVTDLTVVTNGVCIIYYQ